MGPHFNLSNTSLEQALSDPRIIAISDALGPDVELFLVGGVVRDALLGLASTEDIDLATNLSPTAAQSSLSAAGIKSVVTGTLHQTITVVAVEGLRPLELSSYRGQGSRPGIGYVAGSTITEDLRFRDFTINSLALNARTAELLDPLGGATDLQHRIVRATSEERFIEDPLRVLRFVRFACYDSLQADPTTLAMAKAHAPLLETVSIERVRDEFSKILLSKRVDEGLRLLAQLGILEFLSPALAVCVGFEQNRYHPHDVFEHTLEVVQKTRANLTLRLAALLHDVGKPPSLSIDDTGDRHFYRHEVLSAEIAESLLERLRYPTELIREVITLVRTHMRPTSAGAPGIRRLLRDTAELFPLWRELKEADATSVRLDQQELKAELIHFDSQVETIRNAPDVSPLRNLAIRGGDLLELGFPPGPQIGELLRELHEQVLDDPSLNTKEILLRLAKLRRTPD